MDGIDEKHDEIVAQTVEIRLAFDRYACGEASDDEIKAAQRKFVGHLARMAMRLVIRKVIEETCGPLASYRDVDPIG